MRITDAKVVITCPGRNFVTLKLTTEDGLTGLGDATLNGRELSVASYLEDHLVPLLVGRDARRIEDTWQYLYKGAYWRRGPVTMAAIAAVDTALWDIKAKAADMPLYELLGGASREAVLVYAPRQRQGHRGRRPRRRRATSIRATRRSASSAASPGSRRPTACRRAACPTSRRRRALPSEHVWSTEAYVDFIPSLFERVRAEFGPELHLLHDVHHRLTPIEAARVGKSLEPFRLWWMEDPVPAELQEGFRVIRQHTTTPIAVGEVFNSIHDCHQLITEQLIDFIRTTVVHGGGISPAAEDRGAGRAVPRPHRLPRRHRPQPGVHGRGAALRPERAQLRDPGAHAAHGRDRPCLPAPVHFQDGFMHPGEGPGLGVEIDETLAAQYPYDPAYLPVNRKLDGTLHSW